MLSINTYHTFNATKTYWRSALIVVTNRFTHSNLLSTHRPIRHDIPTHPTLVSVRHYSDGKRKSGPKMEPKKLSFVDDEPVLTHTERLKRIISNYGSTAVILHIMLSLTSLSFFYTIIYFGVDVSQYIPMDMFGETVTKVMTGSGTFAVAYAIHKMVMPVRIGATVALTPIVVRKLRQIGFIKKPHKHI
ncbi:unnamed protein product [Medioppia subpectinata]|uniref:DUF1279 domain-containing protein n=1 Tax=Medioppia subpectinata TaxID=1979941 RepID=A0A7R9KYW2_9ACAR|nr:unnamed protein product [Medioppia subpectinata]CAG2111293.1 unnamed protein product [Medioppia subpectinata]